MSWSDFDPLKIDATDLTHGVAYSWSRCNHGEDHPGQSHTIHCLWIWHDCQEVLGINSVAPGDTFGWRPSGVSAHTLVNEDPLTITASVFWPECCGMHGFITDGLYLPV